MSNVCVFGGSRNGCSADFAVSATDLGTAIAQRGWGCVYGGGKTGLMGAIAQGVLDANGHIIGVIPQFLARREILHDGLSETIVVDDLMARKDRMMALSNAYIGVPGGLGTLDELLEVITWRQLGRIDAPIGLLNVDGYFAPFLSLLQHCQDQEFVGASDLEHLVVASRPSELLDGLAI